MRLAQEVAALHLAPPVFWTTANLSPVLVPAVALGMVLQPAIDELGGPLGKPVLLNQPDGRLLRIASRPGAANKARGNGT